MKLKIEIFCSNEQILLFLFIYPKNEIFDNLNLNKAKALNNIFGLCSDVQ